MATIRVDLDINCKDDKCHDCDYLNCSYCGLFFKDTDISKDGIHDLRIKECLEKEVVG